MADSRQDCRNLGGLATVWLDDESKRSQSTTPRRPEPERSLHGCIRFPPNGFAVSLTLFSKCFSPFPHGTCSLSVSCWYLALSGVYHHIWAAFPNNPTLRRQILLWLARPHTGLSPSTTCPSRSTSTPQAIAKLPLPATTRWQQLPEISGSSSSHFARRYWGNPC